MNLVLLSLQISSYEDVAGTALLRLMDGKSNRSITYVPSQSDRERYYFGLTRKYYQGLGLELSAYFDPDGEYRSSDVPALLESGAIHLSGGSTFHFLQNLVGRNLLPVLREYAAGGGVLIGVSAGAILMTPRIDSSILCGDPVIPGLDTGALGLVPWEFLPHFDGSDSSRRRVEEYSGRSGKEIYVCRDGGAILVTPEGAEFIGAVERCRAGAWVPASAG